MNDGTTMPAGAPQAVLIEGLLDGRVADATALQAAAATLGTAGAGTFRCEIVGGRFTLLPHETQVAGASFDEAAQERFWEALLEVVAAASPRSVESNLRWRMIYANEVTETLFVVRGDTTEAMTRVRPRTPADDAMLAPAAPALPAGLQRREVLLAAPALLLLGLVLAWWSGWFDRLLAARAESLHIDHGPFAAMLDVGVTRAWGTYRIEVRRGSEYPATPQALADRRAASDSLTGAAACDVVGNGGELFVQTVAGDGTVLDQVRIELRSLLGEPTATVDAKLPGRMQAATLRLSLSAAAKPR